MSLAEHIGQLISNTDLAIGQWGIEQRIDRDYRDQQDAGVFQVRLEVNGKWRGAVKSILADAPALAREIETAGQDSTDVLWIAHTLQHGGGPGKLLPAWANAKVRLQRLAIKSQLAEPATCSDHSTCFEVAYTAYKVGLHHWGKAPTEVTDMEVYDYLQDKLHEIKSLGGIALPTREQWQNYVSKGRKAANEPKNTRKAGRTGGSVVKASDI